MRHSSYDAHTEEPTGRNASRALGLGDAAASGRRSMRRLRTATRREGPRPATSLTARYVLRVTFTVAVTLRSAARRWPGTVFHVWRLAETALGRGWLGEPP